MMPAVSPRVPNSRPASVLAQIGNTPLVRLERITADLPGVDIFVKLEFVNPGGSVKDRPALNMILDGERTGRLVPGRIILDATSGNTGIAYAMIGAAKGYRVKLCLPRQRLPRAQAHPESLRRGDRLHRSQRGLRRRHPPLPRDLRSRPRPLLLPRPVQQPGQLAGALRNHGGRDHRTRPTADLTHFVAGLGTSGTFIGVTRRLRPDAARRRVLLRSSRPPVSTAWKA